MKSILTLTLLLFSINIFSAEERYLNRSAHGLLVGDAYTARADGAFTLFYNPALLARHTGFSFWAINPQVDVTNPLDDPDKYSDLGSSPNEIADVLFSSPIHVGLGAAPGFKMGRFGLSAILNNNSNLTLYNKVTPMLDIDYRFDKGFIMGYAHPLWGNYSTKGGGGEHLAFGLSVKYIQRESIYGTYNLTSPTLYRALESGDIDTILSSLGQVKGSGWGFDMGLDYAKRTGANGISVGLAITDVYTNLITDSNENDAEVQPQYLQANLGVAWEFGLAESFGLVLSADYRNLEDSTKEFSKKTRFGVELKMSPALSLMGGVNSGLYSYGLKFSTGFLTLYGGMYGADVGQKQGQVTSDRAIVYLSLFDFTFDG
tara:strand:- start:125224 stop:126342 length:1119 start_codon:yes stop_codon:yes gene_type:complete